MYCKIQYLFLINFYSKSLFNKKLIQNSKEFIINFLVRIKIEIYFNSFKKIEFNYNLYLKYI